MDNNVTTIYQARNKAFCIVYWTREEAQAFCNEQPASAGFRVEPIQVFGDKEKWIKEQFND